MKKSLALKISAAFVFAAALGFGIKGDASASGTQSIRVGSSYVYSNSTSSSNRNSYSGTDVTYDATTNTLTLNNYTGEKEIRLSGFTTKNGFTDGITLNVIGTNRASNFTISSGTINVTGSGTLTLTDENATFGEIKFGNGPSISGSVLNASDFTGSKGSLDTTPTTDKNPDTFDPIAFYVAIFAFPVIALTTRYALRHH